MKTARTVILALLIGLVLAACGKANTPTATKAVAPAATSSPTALPQPSATPAPTASPTPSPSPTPPSFTENVRQLQEALRRHDVHALTFLMADKVQTGFYGTDYGWKVEADKMAATLAEGAPTANQPPCWAFAQLPQATEVVLGGFKFAGGKPWMWRLADGDVEAVLFIYENRPPYRITAVYPLTNGDRSFFQGMGCEKLNVLAAAYPTPLPTPTPAKRLCPNSPPPRLVVGEYAYVAFSPPLANRIRNIPAKQGKIIDRAQPGESMKVLDGPVCRDGWTWWKVRLTRSHLIGWTAEGDGDTYWLKPCHTFADCP